MLEKHLDNLFWKFVGTPRAVKTVASIYSHEYIRKIRMKNFNLRFIELLESPDCFKILKQSVKLGADKYYLPTILTRVIIKRRQMGIYNELYELI